MASRQAPPIQVLNDLETLLPNWQISLRVRGRQPGTISSYLNCARSFNAFLVAHGMPTAVTSIAREHVEHFLADLSERVGPATVAKHYRSLQQLFNFLVDDGEISRSPMERMYPPAVPEQPVPILTDAELVALIAACKGQSLENRRDEAVIRTFVDTGIRVSELVGLTVEDVDLAQQLATVIGKGGRGRAVPFGIKTTDALRRYLKARRAPPEAARTPALCLGRKGTADRVPSRAAARAPRQGCRGARPASAPVQAHDGAPLALRGRAGAGPDAAGRLAYAGGWSAGTPPARLMAEPGRRTGGWGSETSCERGGQSVGRSGDDPRDGGDSELRLAEQDPHLRGLVRERRQAPTRGQGAGAARMSEPCDIRRS